MKNSLFINALVLFFICNLYCSYAQNRILFPTQQVKQWSEFVDANFNILSSQKSKAGCPKFQSGVPQILNIIRNFKLPEKLSCMSKSDTLIITDSVVVTGTYFHQRPIFVLNNGYLKFKNANATIVGDIAVWGSNARLETDSSSMYFPQEYFYQRSLILAGNAHVKFSHTSFDHSGLSHNIVVTDSSLLEMNHVINNGFTTNGLSKKAQYVINGSNQAGEFIITDESDLHFSNASTILLWHQIPSGATFNYSFPSNLGTVNFHLDNTSPGIQGINYTITLDTCTDVMWALMPLRNTVVNIANSTIRAIGLWFTGSDTIQVSGLIDNSNYSDFTAALSDRTLKLVNTSVKTWNLYPMERAYINLSGCILGEIGSMGRSYVNGQNLMVDGSGGYLWASDTSVNITGFSSATTTVRSEKNGFMIYAYSSLNMGTATALENSVLMSIQNTLPEDPVPLDGSVVWMANISNVSPNFVDSTVLVTGSAWIDKTAISQLMDFGFYQIYYRKSPGLLWTLMQANSTTEIRNNLLAQWNTHGLLPGSYDLKLVLYDNTPDSNHVEAIKQVNLLPGFLTGVALTKTQTGDIDFFPNPANDKVEITGLITGIVEIISIHGQVIKTQNISKQYPLIDVSNLSAGVYSIKIKTDTGIIVKKLIKQ